jgi:hypothetical protein
VKLLSIALLAASIFFVSSLDGDLEAYLDPGTGSMAIQMILAGVVAGLAAVRVYWYKLKSLFTRRDVRRDASILD